MISTRGPQGNFEGKVAAAPGVSRFGETQIGKLHEQFFGARLRFDADGGKAREVEKDYGAVVLCGTRRVFGCRPLRRLKARELRGGIYANQ